MPASQLAWQMQVWKSRLRHWAKYAVHAPRVYRNWPSMLTSGWHRAPITLRLRNGLQFVVRPGSGDRATINEMFVQNTYLADPRFAIAAGDRVLDIGANIGAFTLLAARAAPRGKVCAVEPETGNFAVLQQNIALNRAENVDLLQVAVGASEGHAVISAAGILSSTVGDSGSSAQTVPQVTLASLVARLGEVDLLKMDCEGAEFDIFFSTPLPVLQKIRRITMEYHNASAARSGAALGDILINAGFEVMIRGGDWNGLLTAIRS
jgi:FkbM family methyltransferase